MLPKIGLVLPSTLFVQKGAFCQAAQDGHTCSEATVKNRGSLTAESKDSRTAWDAELLQKLIRSIRQSLDRSDAIMLSL